MDIKTKNVDKKVRSGFIEALILLPWNDNFNRRVGAVRKKWQITKKQIDLNNSSSRGKWKTLFKKNREMISDIFPIVDKCELGKGKYRNLLIEAVTAYVLLNDPLVPFPDEDSLQFTPRAQLKINKLEGSLNISINIYHDTSMTEIYRTINNKIQRIQQLQKTIKTKRLDPMKNFFRMQNYYLLSQEKSPAQIYKELKIKSPDYALEPNSVDKLIRRFKERIAEAFKDN